MSDPSTEITSESPWARRPVVASLVVVAAILVLGLGLVLGNAFGGDDQAAPDAGGPAPASSTSDPSGASSTTSPEETEPSVCGLPGDEDSGTVTTAPVAIWSLVGTTAAPAVEGSGPGEVEPDGYRSCYAHTPTGALLAAANYSAIGSEDTLRKKFYERASVPGPGRDALLDKPIAGSSGGVRVQIAGFRVLRYTGDQADVDLAIRTSKGAIAGFVANLQWSGGDWKLRLADDGTELSPFVQLPDLAGYIPWSGA